MAKDKTTASHGQSSNVSALPRGTPPDPSTLIGSDEVSLRVFLRLSAWQQMQQLFGAGQIGILAGDVYEDERGPFVVIEGVVPLQNAHGEAGVRQFTEQTLAALRITCAKRFPNKRIVGSFRVRHDSGATLTDYDRYVTGRFFPTWWQLTYVINPVDNRQAVFHWRDERLHSLAGFWVYADEAAVAAAAAKKPTVTTAGATTVAAAAEEVTSDAAPAQGVAVVSLVAALLLLLLLTTLPGVPGSLPSLQRELDDVTSAGERLSAEAAALSVRNEQLQHVLGVLATSPVPAPQRVPTPSRADMSESETMSMSGSNMSRSNTPRSDVTLTSTFADPTDRYVVRDGDTLWSISTRLLGDPYAYTDLAEENEITDPDLILPGWELRVRSR